MTNHRYIILASATLFALAATFRADGQESADALFEQLLRLESGPHTQALTQAETQAVPARREQLIRDLCRLCKDDPELVVNRLRYGTQTVEGDEEALGWFFLYEIRPVLDCLGRQVSPQFLKVAEDEGEAWMMRAWAVTCLGYVRESNAVPLLAQTAASEVAHGRLRQEAVSAIGSIGVADKTLVRTLLPLLSSTNDLFRLLVIRTLASVGTTEAIAPMHEMLEKGVSVREVLHALTTLEGTNAIALLRARVDSPDRWVRETAFNCLGDIDAPTARALLTEKLIDPNPQTAEFAAIYLHPHSSTDALEIVRVAIEERRKRALEPAPEMVRRVSWAPGERGWQLALLYINDPEPKYRSAAAKALGSRPEYKEAIVVLQQRLGRETDKEVRDSILGMLRNYNDVPDSAKKEEGKP